MKKIIGICTTKINDEFSRNFINYLNEAAGGEFSVAVFHSVFDFSNKTIEKGARTIFDMLPFGDLCAVVILRDALFDTTILDNIIGSADAHGVPVIMARGLDGRCYSLTADFEEAYERLLDRVVKSLDGKEAFYIAGRQHDDPHSAERIAVYRRVLEKNGLKFDPANVEYGEYWEVPTARAINRILDKNSVPGAIFCANDVMAFTVIEKLREKGIRVPEDTLVTGFDGLYSSKYYAPSVSTCSEDTNELAHIAADTVKKLCAGEEVPKVQSYGFYEAIRQSSERGRKVPSEEADSTLFFRVRADEINERIYTKWLDTVISVPCIENLRRNIPEMSMNEFSVSIRADAFLDQDSGAALGHPSEYLTMKRGKNGSIKESFCPAENIIHNYLEGLAEGQTAFFAMISNSDFVYGIAFTPTSNVNDDAQKINRYIKTLNRALYVALCGESLLKSKVTNYQEKYIDALTGLLNIDGANKWFSEVVATDLTRSNQFIVGVYTFINYQQVLENYGTHVNEETMQYIAKSLKMANPGNTAIARISADSFAVMFLHSPEINYAEVIDKTVGLFYSSINMRNRSGEAVVEPEISCGYHIASSPWECKLSECISAATSMLYRNRVSFEKFLPKSLDVADNTQLLEFRTAFMTLLDDNLLTYFFQPIVNARTGEIYAYEALMRTTGGINMSPLDVISAATLFSKLGTLEYMSFINIFERLSSERKAFGDRQVFINTIPRHFLTANECVEICEKYGDLLSRAVIEITESETIPVEELEAIRTFGGNKGNIRIAIDDYGTGHSNIVNLLEYKPQIVKIDRYLITNIQNDRNKQMFVKSIIEFSRENDIKVLAEGVETSEEMDTVIDFGVDYIQGYYTARPSAEIIQEIPEDIRRQIAERAAK